MNIAKRSLIFAVGALFAGATVLGDVAELKKNPYMLILDINPFRLKDPRPQTKERATNVVNLDVRISGITSSGGTKRAWLVIPPGPGGPSPSISTTCPKATAMAFSRSTRSMRGRKRSRFSMRALQ